MQLSRHAVPLLASAGALAGLLALAPSAASEELTIVSKMTRGDAAPVMATSYLGADHMRIAQGEGQEFMVDLKTGQMTILDGRKKQYSVMTRQDLEQFRTRLQEQMNSPEMKKTQEQMQKAQEQMKNLPPDVQKKMQGMQEMMGGLASSVTVAKTGTRRKVAGYNCETWTISVGQLSKTEQCMTTELALPMQAWDTYRDMADSFKNLAAAMGPMGKGATEMAEKMKQVKGFPIATATTVTIGPRTMVTTSEVTEVKKGAIPASAWAIPSDYTKVDSPMMKSLPKAR